MVLSNGGHTRNDLRLMYHLAWREARTLEDLLRLLPVGSDPRTADWLAFLAEVRESMEGLRDGV